VILELTHAERRLLLRAVLRSDSGPGGFLADDHTAMADRLIKLQESPGATDNRPLPLPLESHEPQRPDVPSAGPRNNEQLPGAVPNRRSQSSDQPQRSAQGAAGDGLRDYFSGDIRKHRHTEKLEVTPVAIEDKNTTTAKRLVVSWENSTGRGFSTAAVWDEALFPQVRSRLKKPATFYVEATKDNRYLNILGVRA
jgi:hypothetical protein